MELLYDGKNGNIYNAWIKFMQQFELELQPICILQLAEVIKLPIVIEMTENTLLIKTRACMPLFMATVQSFLSCEYKFFWEELKTN